MCRLQTCTFFYINYTWILVFQKVMCTWQDNLFLTRSLFMRRCQQTWQWRRSDSMSGPHKKPQTRKSARSLLLSPSQRPHSPQAPAMVPTAPPPLPSPPRPRNSSVSPRIVPGRSLLRRPWPCQIQVAGTPFLNFPAFSPGIPVHSLNENLPESVIRCIPGKRLVNQRRMTAQHIPKCPSASSSEADFSLSWWSQPLEPQKTRRWSSNCLKSAKRWSCRCNSKMYRRQLVIHFSLPVRQATTN